MRATTKLHGAALIVAAALVSVTAESALAQAPSPAATMFEKRCYSCHNIGSGVKKGPDLKGVTDRRTKEWLHEFIETPAALNRNGDPAATDLFKKFAPEVMPDQAMSTDEIDAILAMIDGLTKKGETFVPAGAKLARPVAPDDVDAGLRLFTGRTRLSGGGTACNSCHSLNGAGWLGGGTLGPNLTAVNQKYRDPELISILQNPNFPTMNTVFAAHPLNDEEIVQLFALFQNQKLTYPTAQVQPGAAAATAEPKFLVIGFAALVVALLAANFTWKDRLRGIREELVKSSRKKAQNTQEE
ncbi:MAG TPA: cytochrome c [Blastocatellia bacterium]|nr:cytochrome c [Blastocatellia bacterium]